MKRMTAEKFKFSIAQKDEAILELVRKADHRTLAIWAVDCAGRVLHYFEEKYPEDPRPRNALETCRAWINTGVFKMAVIRGASLAAHAAARDAGEDSADCPAEQSVERSAARAAGHAVATAHVPTHSIGAANYALQAVYRAAGSADPGAAVAVERDWQYRHLLELIRSPS
jgi:hypothetical protein